MGKNKSHFDLVVSFDVVDRDFNPKAADLEDVVVSVEQLLEGMILRATKPTGGFHHKVKVKELK